MTWAVVSAVNKIKLFEKCDWTVPFPPFCTPKITLLISG